MKSDSFLMRLPPVMIIWEFQEIAEIQGMRIDRAGLGTSRAAGEPREL